MDPSPSLLSDVWLSEMLQIPVFSVLRVGNGLFPEGGSRFLYIKVEASNNIAIKWCREQGFCLVSTMVTLEKYIDKNSKMAANCRIACPEDEDAVGRLASTAFTSDRFHRDNRIATAKADKIKEQWAKNYFNGSRGDNMIISTDEKGQLNGFLQIIKEKDSPYVIDLIAISEDDRGKGYAKTLISSLESVAGKRSVVRVSTQRDNKRSLALYNRIGFQELRTSHVFHRWDE